MSKIKIRYSVRELQEKYEVGNKKPLEDLMRAWQGIKELDPNDLNSFFVIGGYHGEPFEGPGKVKKDYWGGYCNHGNVLFPTWHRVYVHKIEQALQSIDGCSEVTLPYWDETTEESLKLGIPWALTNETFILDGVLINNPLRSYVLQQAVGDSKRGDNQAYTKPKGYETVRYPLSGLVSAEYAIKTQNHNFAFSDYVMNQILLNKNVKAWLHGSKVTSDVINPQKDGIFYQYKTCLDAPNYTAFSNTTSAQEWNKQENTSIVVALESPHNDIHLAVGGFDADGSEYGQIPGANGDMGENNTAALDPIFFFHHCNVDRMFWLWQIKQDKTDKFEIIPFFPGTSTNYSDNGQGPAVGQQENEHLKMDTPLSPFLKDQNDPDSYYTSNDCINIEKQLGVTYSAGSFTDIVLEESNPKTRKLKVYGINRSLFGGSFIIRAFITIDEKPHYLGRYSVLSRWNTNNCANCQTHLGVSAFFDLSDFSDDEIKRAKFSIKIHHRGETLPDQLKYDFEVIE